MKKFNPESIRLASELLEKYGIGIDTETKFGIHFNWETTKLDAPTRNNNHRLATLSIGYDRFALSTPGTTWTFEEAGQLVKETNEVMTILTGLEAIDPELVYHAKPKAE